MPSEKELNVNLLDKLDILERLEMADNEGGMKKWNSSLHLKKSVLSASYTRNRQLQNYNNQKPQL